MMNKDFETVYWSRGDAPIAAVIELARKYKHYYKFHENNGRPGQFIIFSDFKIKSDDEAQKLIWLEVQ
jgi:hypothetical protein